MKLSEARKATSEAVAVPPGEALMPCLFCGTHTQSRVLSLYGARCDRCYRQYLELGYSGNEPPRQQRQAAWVPAAAERARRGPKGSALKAVMTMPESASASDWSERKQQAQEMTNAYQRERS